MHSLLFITLVHSVPSNSATEVTLNILGHIVIEKSQDDLQTQNGQNIQIKDSMVKYGELEVPILFSETHYGQDLEKVKILCIKRPLTEASFEFHDEVGKYLIHRGTSILGEVRNV